MSQLQFVSIEYIICLQQYYTVYTRYLRADLVSYVVSRYHLEAIAIYTFHSHQRNEFACIVRIVVFQILKYMCLTNIYVLS